jgi:hypothetical protein
MKLLKKLLKIPIVKWKKNIGQKHHKEDNYYLLVENDDEQYLFTNSEAAMAAKRAMKNPEDFE